MGLLLAKSIFILDLIVYSRKPMVGRTFFTCTSHGARTALIFSQEDMSLHLDLIVRMKFYFEQIKCFNLFKIVQECEKHGF